MSAASVQVYFLDSQQCRVPKDSQTMHVPQMIALQRWYGKTDDPKTMAPTRTRKNMAPQTREI